MNQKFLDSFLVRQIREIVNEIQKSDIKIVMTLGAGDIGAEVKNIKENLSIAS